MRIYKAEWYQANKDWLDPLNRAWYADRPGSRKEQAARDYEKRRDAILEYNRQYGADHADERAAYLAQYRRDNPEKIAAHKRGYKAMKKGAEGSHTGDDILALSDAQNGKCAYCPASLKKTGYHVDHIKPLSKGGSNDRANLQLTCPKCNLRKRDADPEEFARRIGLLI